MEYLHWLIRQKNKPVTDEDIVTAFTRYCVSDNGKKVHRKIRDFIGDENVCPLFHSVLVEGITTPTLPSDCPIV